MKWDAIQVQTVCTLSKEKSGVIPLISSLHCECVELEHFMHTYKEIKYQMWHFNNRTQWTNVDLRKTLNLLLIKTKMVVWNY